MNSRWTEKRLRMYYSESPRNMMELLTFERERKQMVDIFGGLNRCLDSAKERKKISNQNQPAKESILNDGFRHSNGLHESFIE